MDNAMRELLERARHALSTLSGLYACDGARPGTWWRIDEKLLIAEIDKHLPSGPGPLLQPLRVSPPDYTPEQLAEIEEHWKGMLKNLHGQERDGIRVVVVAPDLE